MNAKLWMVLLVAAVTAPSVVAARASEDLDDAPPLVKDDGAPKAIPAPPVPTPAPAAEDAEPTPPPKPTRVGPPAKTEAPEEPEGMPTGAPVETEEPGPPPKPVEELKDAPPLVPSGRESWMERTPLFRSGDASILQVSSRLDVAFLAGGSIQQGFTLPSVRLTAAGSTGEVLHYRLSLGETREFSSAQLPQITPVEGYIELRSGGNATVPLFAWRVGMFTPEFSPWWTPDLSEVDMPDYHEIDRVLLLSRDLGAQLTVRPVGEKLKISAGVFNGTGIVTLNTNSSRAFTGNLELDLGTKHGTSFALGGAAYRVQQASAGSVNYRMNTVGSLYGKLDLFYGRLRLTGEVLGGQLVDSTGSSNPFGGAGTIDFGLWQAVRLFARAEGLQGSGIGNGLLHHYQFGPVIELSRSCQAWLVYDYLDGEAPGSPQQQGILRFRLSV